MENRLFLYNTLTRSVEKFIPNVDGKVSMYTCGPTVYHFAHIGNLRSYLMEDVLEKMLRYMGYDVKRVMNITDVGHLTSDADTGEDKMVKGAKREGKTVAEIADFYKNAFFADCDKLNIKRPDVIENATACIDEYIEMIAALFEKGFAYKAGGNVYFDTSRLEKYYALTNHKSEELLVGVREDVEEDVNKRNKTDFVLWFTDSKFGAQELRYDSPWGYGYPGWHIECSAISRKHLGEYLDIHCGGVDNIFPHHTNEIAQSEAVSGHKWCNYWFHIHHLNDNGGKMAKSKGDILTVSTLESKGYAPLVYRFFCLQSHYRKPLEFSYSILDNSKAAYEKLKRRIAAIPTEGETDENALLEYREKFISAVASDMNTALGLSLIYEVLKADLSGSTKRSIIDDFDRVLSLDLTKGEEAEETDAEDTELDAFVRRKIQERAEARKAKDFKLADAIRNELLEQGIVLKDSPQGTTWSRQN